MKDRVKPGTVLRGLVLAAVALVSAACPRRPVEAAKHVDPAADAVLGFLALRTDDYGKAFLLSDDVTGERINVSVDEIATHRGKKSASVETIGVSFSAAFSDDPRHWDVDFQVEMNGDAANVIDYRIHKTSSREDPAVLVERAQ